MRQHNTFTFTFVCVLFCFATAGSSSSSEEFFLLGSSPCKVLFPTSNTTWIQTLSVNASWQTLPNVSLPYVTVNLIRPSEVHTLAYYMPNTGRLAFPLALHLFLETPFNTNDWQIQVMDARDMSGSTSCLSPTFTILRPAIDVQLTSNTSRYFTEGSALISYNTTVFTNNSAVCTSYNYTAPNKTIVVITNCTTAYSNFTVIDDVLIYLSNNVSSYYVSNYSASAATYQWTPIPFLYASQQQYQMTICWEQYPTLCGSSSWFFIQNPDISVDVPQNQTTGSEIISEWEVDGADVVSSVSVNLLRNTSGIEGMPPMCSNVTSGQPPLCDFWYLPFWLIQSEAYTVSVCWDLHPSVCGYSTPFLITATIQVYDVVETGVMLVGATYLIRFNIHMSGVDSVVIDLYQGTTLYQNIAPEVQVINTYQGNYTWTATNLKPSQSTQYTVRVTFPSFNSPFGSTSQFTMINESMLAPLSVINPTSNTEWDSTSKGTNDILWLSVDYILTPYNYSYINTTFTPLGYVSIDLFLDGGWFYTINGRVANYAGANHYNWSIPDTTPVSTNYTIRVCYLAGLKHNVTCSFSLSFSVTGVEAVSSSKIVYIALVIGAIVILLVAVFTLYIKCIRKTRYVDPVYSCDQCYNDNTYRACVTASHVNVYRGDTHIIRDFSWHFPSGQFTVLKGPSGCGKSTLLEVLNGIYNSSFFDRWGWKVDGGIFYVPSTNFALHNHEKCVGYVPQFSNFYPSLTTEANLYYGAKISGAEVDDRFITHLLQVFKLYERKGVKVEGLSGGQQKRLSIAMALVRTPRILWLDEPTSGLDDESALICCKLLRWLAENCSMTVVAVIHQDSAELRQYFHSIVMLNPDGVEHKPITHQDHFNYYLPNYNVRVALPKQLDCCSGINFGQFAWLFFRALSQSFRGISTRAVDVLISFLFTTLFAWMVGAEHYQGPMDGASQCLYPEATCQLLRPIMELPRSDPIIAQGSLVLLSIGFTGLMASMRVFSMDLKPFLAEYHETSLSHGAYFLAKHLVELIWSVLPPAAVVLIWNVMVSLVSSDPISIPHFFPIATQLWLVYWISMEIGFVLSISLSIQPSLVIGAGILNVFFVFNGIRPPIPTLPSGSLRAILYHFSFFRFSLENYYITEIDGLDGEDAGLATWGYDTNNYNRNLGILFIFWSAFAILAYTALTIRISLYGRTGLKPEKVTNNRIN